jgi:hypothetical protein
MPRPQEADLLRRTLSGDWQSRVEFFGKFILDSSRVRRFGAAYSNLDDFLHDCMTNAMRTGHSFDADQSLGDWVESVAAWTALERQRQRVDGASAMPRGIRLCAGVDGDETEKGAIRAYVPPRSGVEDSPASRIAALVGTQQFTLLSKRGIENRTWEETATDAGQPLNTVGPVLVRTVDRLIRFFGAPPPLNADLEPVFTSIVRPNAAGKQSDGEKPKGRVIAMQLDPTFYSLTPEMRKIGLTVPAEVRTIALWDAARASTPPNQALRDHLAQCRYCADLLRALLLMQEALQSGSGTEFLLCPGGFTLLNTQDGADEPFDRHMTECGLCRQERVRTVSDPERETAKSSGSRPRPVGKMAWAAVGVVLVGGAGYFAQHQYFAKKPELPPPTEQIVADTPAPALAMNSRYRDLAQRVNINDLKWLNSALPENRQSVALGIDRLQRGRIVDAKFILSGLRNNDPGAAMLYAFVVTRNAPSDGYAAVLKAEAMPPRNPFRCWTTLQAALVVGDMKTIEQEVQHLSSDPEYADRAKAILERARARR